MLMDEKDWFEMGHKFENIKMITLKGFVFRVSFQSFRVEDGR